MKPIFFPSTCVSDSVAQALAACFGQFIAYQPLAGKIPEHMRPWVEKGILDIRVPVTADQKELEAVLKNYLSWADFNLAGSGLKPPFLKTWKDGIPFFNASAPSKIVADIKEQVDGKPASIAPDPLLEARLFLYFAQEFDRQNQELARDLKRHRQQETELIRQLKMEDDSLTGGFHKEEVPIPDDSADYMVLDRLKAWTRILLKDTDISGIFITQIPAVMQDLLDKTPSAEKLLSFETIPTGTALSAELAPWRQKLVSNLAHIVEHKWAPTTVRPCGQPDFPSATATVALSVYLAPDEMPRDFFSRCAQIQPPDRNTACSGGGFKNTLVGLIEF
ncbi:MAG: hypothetical protein WCB15_16675 [Desulfobacterales bacterium]